jgi:hypothetical protein
MGKLNVGLFIWGAAFTGAGLFLFILTLRGELNSNSEALNASPVLGILVSLLFFLPGVWALQIYPLWKTRPRIPEAWSEGAPGCIFIVLGAFLAVMSFADDDASFSAPRWVVTGAGFLFMLPGFMILFSTAFKNTVLNSAAAQSLFGALIVTLFAAVAVGVAVVPGPQGFDNERLCFLPGALLLSVLTVVAWGAVFKQALPMLKPRFVRYIERYGQTKVFIVVGVLLISLVALIFTMISVSRKVTGPF